MPTDLDLGHEALTNTSRIRLVAVARALPCYLPTVLAFESCFEKNRNALLALSTPVHLTRGDEGTSSSPVLSRLQSYGSSVLFMTVRDGHDKCLRVCEWKDYTRQERQMEPVKHSTE